MTPRFTPGKTRLFLALLLLACLPSSQASAAGWAESYGLTYGRFGLNYPTEDVGFACSQTSDGGFIVAGTTTYNLLSGGGPWVLKLDAAGGVQWQKVIVSSIADRFLSAKQTPDGGYILAGHTVTYGVGDNDLWVMKLGPEGQILWQESFGGPGWDAARSVDATPDGGAIVAGYTEEPGSGEEVTADAWLLKLDAGGAVQWQRYYGDRANGSAAAWSVKATADGGYIAAGGWVAVGAESGFGWLLRLDQAGNVLWQKAVGHRATLTQVYFSSVALAADGGFVAAGQAANDEEGLAAFAVAKFGPSGEVQWQKVLNRNSYDQANSVVQTADGGYLVVGETDLTDPLTCSIGVVKLNPSGEVVWQRRWAGVGNSGGMFQAAATVDGGCAVAGYLTDVQLSTDLLLLKLDADGSLASACPAGSMAQVSEFSALEAPGEVIDPPAVAVEAAVPALPSGAVTTDTGATGCGG